MPPVSCSIAAGAVVKETVALGQVSVIVTVNVVVPADPLCSGFAFAESVMVVEVPFFAGSVVSTEIFGGFVAVSDTP